MSVLGGDRVGITRSRHLTLYRQSTLDVAGNASSLPTACVARLDESPGHIGEPDARNGTR